MKPRLALLSALHLGFIFSQQAFSSKCNLQQGESKVRSWLGVDMKNHIQPEPKGRGIHCLPQRCSVQVCQTGSCQWKEKGITESELSHLKLGDLPSVKILPPCLSSLSNQSVSQSISRKQLPINQLPLDGVKSC